MLVKPAIAVSHRLVSLPPVTPVDVAIGEITWALMRGSLYSISFVGVIVCLTARPEVVAAMAKRMGTYTGAKVADYTDAVALMAPNCAELITAFLEHIETSRHNTTRTRNLRLTAIRSLFTYAALRHPEHAALIQQVLAIPAKRFGKQLITFLTETEIDALLGTR